MGQERARKAGFDAHRENVEQRGSSHATARPQHPLLDRVRRWSGHPHWGELTTDTLRQLTAVHGVDFATALLYARLCDSAEHGPTITCLDAAAPEPGTESEGASRGSRVAQASTMPTDRSRIRVAIVPGGCHEESADSRRCWQQVREAIRGFGLVADVVPTLSFGDLRDNGQRLVAMLESEPDARWIVVSLSKGSAEVKLALRDSPAAFCHTDAWINLSGMLYGSQWVRWLLDRPLSRLSARCWCGYWRYRFAVLEQLRREDGSLLDFDLRPPQHLRVIHVAGFPLAGDLTHPYTRRSFQRLAELGPNDGMGVMLGDLVRAGGMIYPVWQADHFLRPGGLEMRDFVGRVLRGLTGPPAVERRSEGRGLAQSKTLPDLGADDAGG
jgi:hypothetical protein